MNNENNNLRLNQERKNIIEASNIANNSIDEKKAVMVNNQIKYKKKSPLFVIIVLFLVIVFASILTYYFYQPIKKLLKEETTTTTKEITTKISYINRTEMVRKFQNENYILILSNNFNNKMYYMIINKNDDTYLNGEYNLENNYLYLDNNKYEILDNVVKYNNEELEMFDSEMKYYQNNNSLLIINGTLYHEYGLYITNSNIECGKITENDKNIILNDKIFKKDEDFLIIDNEKLMYNF